MKKTIIIVMAAWMSWSVYADTHTWDGGGLDGLWTTADNWDPNQTPGSSDTINISTGDTVTGPNGNLPWGSTINLTGSSTLTATLGALRLLGSTINVASNSALTGNFWDLNQGSFLFENGAIATMSNFEMKGVNTFTFIFGADGFTTLTPGTFRNDGNNPASPETLIADDSFIVDIENYTGNGGTYTIMDFGSDAEGMDDVAFQNATLTVLNAGQRTTSIYWEDSEEAIKIDISALPGMVLLFK